MNNTMRWDWVWDNKENEMRKKTSSQFQISSCATLHFSFIFISFSLPFPLFTSIITQNIFRFLREEIFIVRKLFQFFLHDDYHISSLSYGTKFCVFSHILKISHDFFFLKKRSMEARMMITSIIYLCALL